VGWFLSLRGGKTPVSWQAVDALDTTDPILPSGSATEPPALPGSPGAGPVPPERSHPWRRVWIVLAVVVGVVTTALVTAAFVQVPYYLIQPGGARATESSIEIEGAPVYDVEGDISFATVSLRQATALQAVMGWFDPTVEVVDRDLILGGRSEDENREANLRDMSNSKDVATAVALERLGYDVTEQGTGAVIVAVVSDVPAALVLTRGDVVVAVDGEPVMLKEDLIDAVGARRPGDVVRLRVEDFDGGEAREVDVDLVARPDEPDRPLLGVTLGTRDSVFQFPFSVTIDSGSVGGPSAGLAFTLGIMDVLTPSSVTGGYRVATTGTIDSQGQVGPVGGVAQKAVAVRRAGIDVFLVPSSEYEEAKKYAGDMRVEAVDTLDDALRMLADLGGGERALAPTGD
jgi:Lon-like protease